MAERKIPLERIRTDGWFERLGESISSFHTLCDVLGERFFAFALIAGARVSSLMIDRFNPDQSLVEFSLGGIDEDPATEAPLQRMTVVEFRHRLVAALLAGEPPPPRIDQVSADDLDGVQRFIGPRVLLLAPLYGYGLKELVIDGKKPTVVLERAAQIESYPLKSFQARLREHVQEDLERGVERQGGTAIDLEHVAKAEAAAKSGDHKAVVALLGSWPMPLAIYWRTPEGQMLPEAARQRIADGLGLLGTAVSKLGDPSQGEEILRLAVQYAQDGRAAAGIFQRLGRMLLDSQRYGEAVGPLRRAQTLGAPPKELFIDLATAFSRRGRHVAAIACVEEAARAGADKKALAPLRSELEQALGPALVAWKKAARV
ncbi:MAG: hypothetical protein HY908_17870 [Myxococcales bacterium]|nr:hypothetical protein [Myxococcales bacterium]